MVCTSIGREGKIKQPRSSVTAGKDKVKLEERKKNSQNLPVGERAERNRPKQGTFGSGDEERREMRRKETTTM